MSTEPWDMRCGLPDCGATLHMVWHYDMAIPAGATVGLLADAKSHHTSSWEVICEEGHTVLLPVDNGGDYNDFGVCKCEPTEPYEDRWCGHGDMARLARVAAPVPPSSADFGVSL